MTFHFTATVRNTTAAAKAVTVENIPNVLEAALQAGHELRAAFAADGVTGHLDVIRVESLPVADEFAAVRAEGRRNGLTEAQIDRFIARMAA